MLLEVLEYGLDVEAEEGVFGVGFVMKLLYLEVEGGQLKEMSV